MTSASRLPALLACCAALAFAGTAAAQVCGPFGDPPRPMTLDPTQTTCAGGTSMPAWADADGTVRHACLWEPASASPTAPLPLIIYLQPSLFTADTVPVATNILSFQSTANVSGDRARPGFIVVAPWGRSTEHYYPAPDDQGTGWDNWYRQFDPDSTFGAMTYRENVDVAAIDHFVDAELATGKVDTRRIYVTGWSNGAAMGVLYALNRKRVAAAAVYTAPNPFEAFDDPCAQLPVGRAPRSDGEIRVANPRLALYHVHNACDIAGICPNGELMRAQLRHVHARVTDVIIDGSQQQVAACDPGCGTNPDANMSFQDDPRGFTEGTQNHTRWPDQWTASMLDFFRRHRGRRMR